MTKLDLTKYTRETAAELLSLCCSLTCSSNVHEPQVAEGEVRVALLQRDVERLSQALLKAQESESSLKEKVTSLNQSLQEVAAAHSSTETRRAALQKSLSVSEQDKRPLQVSETKTKTSSGQKLNGVVSDHYYYMSIRNGSMNPGCR